MDEIQVTFLKFFAAALIKAIPPMSIFSIISDSLLLFFTVSSKG